MAGLGITPAVAAFGPLVGLDIRGDAFALQLDGRALVPSAGDVSGGTARVGLVAGAGGLCALADGLQACALVVAGVQSAEGSGFETNGTVDGLYAGVGGRVGYDLPLGERWWIRAAGELLAATTRLRLEVDGSSGWETPPVGGSAFVGLAARPW